MAEELCVNCGQPATQYTTNRGADVAHFCDNCARQVYPQGLQTGQLQQIPSDQPEIPDRFEAAKPKRSTKKAAGEEG